MKILHISDILFELNQTVGTLPVDTPDKMINNQVTFINTSNITLINLLEKLKDVDTNLLVIYAELKFTGGHRQNHQGVELLKHIRLTPELININKKPILLLHWMDIEYYIEQDKENLFLFSPAIYRRRLPVNFINTDVFKPLDENFLLNDYIFNSEKDEQLSEHAFRNILAIEQFEKQHSTNSLLILDKQLWFKKLYYKHGYFSETINLDASCIDNEIDILLIDDLADEWKPALIKVMPNAIFQLCKSKEEALDKLQIIKENLLRNRDNFKSNVTKLNKIIREISEKEQLRKDLLLKTNSLKQQKNASDKKLEECKILQSNKINEFNELVNSLSGTGKLLDLLFSYKGEKIEIENDLKKDANRLNDLINAIYNDKTIIANEQNLSKKTEEQNNENSSKTLALDVGINDLYKQRNEISKKINILFENAVKKEFNIVLLDMHLSKESEGKQPEKMDGYEIMLELQNLDLNIPVAFFSATTKKLDTLYNNFLFLHKHQYIKGITPINVFIELIQSLQKNSLLNYLNSVIDEICDYPLFLSRIYYDYNSSEYDVCPISETDKINVRTAFKNIKLSLLGFKDNNSKEHLKNIVRTLGDIQANYRFKVKREFYNERNSLFKFDNLRINRIESCCSELNTLRNMITHVPKIQQDIDYFENWQRKLNLSEIHKLLRTVYEGLIFDK